MSKWIKGMVIGTVIGVTIGSMINMDDVACVTKRYVRKGKRMLRNMM